MNNSLIKNKCVWILDDDKDCQLVYERVLDFRYKTVYFNRIEEFKAALSADNVDLPMLIISDLILSDGNLLNFLGSPYDRQLLQVPFMVVSSIDDIDAIRYCFKEGALDYLTKPIKKNELLVKVENILSGGTSRVVINTDQKNLTLDGRKINNLTSKQLQVLSLFLQSPVRTVNRTDILKKVWGSTSVHPKTVDVHLYNLRRKLNTYGYLIRSEGGGKWSLLSNRIDAQVS